MTIYQLCIITYNSEAGDWAVNSEIPVIWTKDPKYQTLIGNAKEASEEDYLRINRMYKCKNHLK